MSNRRSLVIGGLVALGSLAGLASFSRASSIHVSTLAPTPGADDIYQLNYGSYRGSHDIDTLNYYSDNNPPPGQTFTTLATNPGGYLLESLTVRVSDQGTGGGAGNSLEVQLQSVSGSTSSVLYSEIFSNPSPGFATGNWLTFVFTTPQLLAPGTTYAYDILRLSGNYTYVGFDGASGNPYPGGQIALVSSGGGTLTYGPSHNFDATFDLGIVTPLPKSLPGGLLLIGIAGVIQARRVRAQKRKLASISI